MRSRIVAILLSVSLFLATLYISGFEVKPTIADIDRPENTPKNVETVVCSFKNISYGQNPQQVFDLTLPIDHREEIGIVVFIHGGGWVGGDKTALMNYFKICSPNKNYAVAAINYRLAALNTIDVYDMINDITSALTKIKSMAEGYSVNIGKVILLGHSAGGHLSLLYAYRYKDISPIDVVGVFASAPVVDLSYDYFYTHNLIGNEEYMCSLMSKTCGIVFTPATRATYKDYLLELSPVSYVSETSVPTVIIHGKKDKIAYCASSLELDAKLEEFSVDHNLILFENSGHSLSQDPQAKIYAESFLKEKIFSLFSIDTQ